MTTIQYGSTTFPNNQVNGGTQPGVFLSGTFDFFSVTTTVPCFPTNVDAPIASAHSALNVSALSSANSVTIVDGTGASNTYTSDAAYNDAFNTQANLNTLIQVFATRANPVMVSVAASAAVSAAGTSYTINLATEHAPLWSVGVSTESNINGYNFMGANGIYGVPALNTAGVTVAGGVFASGNISMTERSTL